MKILSASEKKKIVKQLDEQFGIGKLNFLFARFGKNKIRAYSGSLSKEEIQSLDKETRIEIFGVYAINENENQLRLNLDFIHLIKDKITKNILGLDKVGASLWLKGQDVEIGEEKGNGFKIIKFGEDFIGCGRVVQGILKNYMPKERRIKG